MNIPKCIKKIRMQCLLADERFHEIINTYNHDDYMVTHNKPVSFDTYTYASYAVADKESGDIIGQFQSLQSDDALYVFSGESADFFKNVVLRILGNLYPTVLFAFIHSADITIYWNSLKEDKRYH